MSDYKTIHGISIRDYTTDPDNLIVGQVWFDKTNKVLQFQATGAGAWSTGGSLNVGGRYGSGFGTQTSGLIFGGLRQGLSADRGETEQYNGTSFTEVGDLNTARSLYGESGVGTTTAGACIAGYSNPGNSNYANVENWNGSGWAETTDVNTARNALGGSGTYTEGVIFAGRAPSKSGHTERWNGTAWTEQNNMSRNVAYVGNATASGTSTFTATADSNANPSAPAACEEWNDPTISTKTADTD